MDQNKKDKFQFVKKETDTFLLEEDETTVQEAEKSEEPKKESQIDPEGAKKKQRRKKIRRLIIGTVIMFIISAILFVFGLLWQDAYDMLAICNSLWLVFALEFTMGWSLFVYNKNIFSPLIHGTKTFALMLIGRKPKKSYYEYMMYINENPVPTFYYLLILTFALVILIPAVILMLMLI